MTARRRRLQPAAKRDFFIGRGRRLTVILWNNNDDTTEKYLRLPHAQAVKEDETIIGFVAPKHYAREVEIHLSLKQLTVSLWVHELTHFLEKDKLYRTIFQKWDEEKHARLADKLTTQFWRWVIELYPLRQYQSFE